MKIVRIGKDKIKIVLSEEEVMNQKNIIPGSKDMDIFIEYIAKEVQRETGVFIKNCSCLVEGVRSNEGMVLYITDIHAENNYYNSRKSGNNRIIFDINSVENLFLLLKSLNEKACEKMRIYHYKSCFFVSVPRFPIPIHMCEFSLKWRKSRIEESVLSEHGRLIAKNEQVLRIAKEIKKHF